MTPAFFILALITLAGAVGAMFLRRMVHCALSLVVAFAGLAGLYLQLSAQFVGLVQLLVYVGAVAILIVFAILLTRNSEGSSPVVGGQGWAGLGVAGLGLITLVTVVLDRTAGFAARQAAPEAEVSIRAVGRALMETYVVPLEAVGLLLTAALIGGVILAMKEPRDGRAEAAEEEEER